MKLVEKMIELLKELDKIPETPISLELCILLPKNWHYAVIKRDSRLLYPYHIDALLAKEELIEELKKREQGDIAVIAYYDKPVEIQDLEYLYWEETISISHKVVLQTRVY